MGGEAMRKCTSDAPASRIICTILTEVVPRTIESSISTMRPHDFANIVHVAAADDRIRASEIDVFKYARTRRHRRKRPVRMHALLIEHHDLSVLDVAQIFGADDVEGAGLRG